MIVSVGIGFEKGDLTERGKKAIKEAKIVVARSKERLFGLDVDQTLEDIAASSADFDEYNKSAAERLIDLEKQHGEVVFLSVGDGFSDPILELLTAQNHKITHIAGVSFTRPASASCLILSAFDLCLRPVLDNLPLLVTDIGSKLTAGEVKLFLLKTYSFDTQVVFYHKNEGQKIALEDLDRQSAYAPFSRVFIPAFGGCGEGCDSVFDKEIYTFGDLTRIVERLTSQNGCPWDIEQTHKSIRTNMIEEAYEVVRAIDSGDTQNLVEELGDVLLQSVFHADMGRRSGDFDLSDVLSVLCRKLYTRHTHIFGEHTASGAGDALKNWEDAKALEKDKTQKTDEFLGFPALLRAQKIAKKLLKAGVNLGNDMEIEPDENQITLMLFGLAILCQKNNLDAEVILNSYLDKLAKNM